MRQRIVAILEARAGEHLAELITRRGGVPLLAPALEEVPDVDPAAIAAWLGGWRRRPFKVTIFQTGVGTRGLFQCTDALGLTGELIDLLAASTVVVRGPKPVGELHARGVTIALRAESPFTTETVLKCLENVELAHERVMIQQYGAANRALRAALEARGASIDEISTYRWAIPGDPAPLHGLLDALRARRVDAVVFTSAVQMHHLMDVAKSAGRAQELVRDLGSCVIASIGPVCSRALLGFGIQPTFEASPPKLGPLLTGLESALHG